jgi:hypothetical protein
VPSPGGDPSPPPRAAPLHRFSRIVGSLRIGADWFERAGLAREGPAPRGLCDRLDDLLPAGVAASDVPRAVRAFFEDPAALELEVATAWRPLAALAWRVGAAVMGAVGQLRLPHRRAVVRARMVALDGAREGRGDARGVVRTRADDGGVFQVFAYGVTAGLMSVAIPLPGGHLAGLLRVAVARGVVTLTSRPGDGEARTGVWWVTPWFSLRTPLEETLRFEADGEAGPGSFRATHEQRAWGRVMVEHAYRFRVVTAAGR